MPSPSSAISRFDLSLAYGQFSLLANQKGFVGMQVLPAIPVGMQNASFKKLKVESLLTPIESTKRAPGAPYRASDYEWTTDSYLTNDHGVEEPLDDRMLKIYGGVFPAEQIAAQRAANRVAQDLENEIAAAVFNTSTWTGSALTTAVSIAWNTAASAVPITDIDGAIEKVITSCGTSPNTLILTDYALRKLKRTAQVQDLLKYSGKDDPKDLGAIAGLKAMFGLENVIVAKAIKNTAGEGATPTLTRTWNTGYAMLCCVNGGNDLEDSRPSIGRTIMWTEENAGLPGGESGELAMIVEEYRMENIRGSRYRARADWMVKILHAEAGHLLTNCAT